MPSDDTKAAQRRLKRAEEDARRKAMGAGLNLTDEMLDEAANVTQADIESAGAYWDRNAPAEARGLLDAKPEDDA